MIVVDDLLFFVGAAKVLRVYSAKEAETGAILFALGFAKDKGLNKILVFSYALEVIEAINRV